MQWYFVEIVRSWPQTQVLSQGEYRRQRDRQVMYVKSKHIVSQILRTFRAHFLLKGRASYSNAKER